MERATSPWQMETGPPLMEGRYSDREWRQTHPPPCGLRRLVSTPPGPGSRCPNFEHVRHFSQCSPGRAAVWNRVPVPKSLAFDPFAPSGLPTVSSPTTCFHPESGSNSDTSQQEVFRAAFPRAQSPIRGAASPAPIFVRQPHLSSPVLSKTARRVSSPCCLARESSSYVLPVHQHTRSSHILLDLLNESRDRTFCQSRMLSPTLSQNRSGPQEDPDVSWRRRFSEWGAILAATTKGPFQQFARTFSSGRQPSNEFEMARANVSKSPSQEVILTEATAETQTSSLKAFPPKNTSFDSSRCWIALVCTFILCLLVVLSLIVLMIVLPHRIEKELFFAKLYVNTVGISEVAPEGFNLAVDGVLEKTISQSATVTAPEGLLIEYVKLTSPNLRQFAAAGGISLDEDFVDGDSDGSEVQNLLPDYAGRRLQGGAALSSELEQGSSLPKGDSPDRVAALKKKCGDCWIDPNHLRKAAHQLIPIGRVYFDPFSSNGHSSSATMEGRLFLQDQHGFQQFCENLLENGAAAWILSGLVNVYSSGINFRNIRFDRAMILGGLPLPSGTPARTASLGPDGTVVQMETGAESVRTLSMAFDPVRPEETTSRLKFHTDIILHNQGPTYFTDLGLLHFKLFYGNSTVALLRSEQMPLLIGDNVITLSGELLSDSEALPKMMDNVARGRAMILNVEGDTSVKSDNPFNALLRKISMPTVLEGAPETADLSPILYRQVLELRLSPFGQPEVRVKEEPYWAPMPRNAMRRLLEGFQERRSDRLERRAVRRARRRRLEETDVLTTTAAPRRLVRGDGRALLRAQEAVANGFRIFGRIVNNLIDPDGNVVGEESEGVKTELASAVLIGQEFAEETPVAKMTPEERESILQLSRVPVTVDPSAFRDTKPIFGNQFMDAVNGLMSLILEESGADTRALPSSRAGRFFNGLKRMFARPSANKNTTAATVEAESAPEASIRFRSSPEELLQRALPHLMEALTLRGKVLLGLWHPFSRLSIEDMTMFGSVAFLFPETGWEHVGGMSGRLTGRSATKVDDVPLEITLNYDWGKQRQMGVVSGQDDLIMAGYEININVNPNEQFMRIIQAVLSNPEITIQVSNLNYTASCMANGAVSLKMEEVGLSDQLSISGMQGLGSVRLVDFQIAPTDELALILVLQQRSDAPIVMDTGPLFLNWHFHDEIIGPASVNNLHFGPGENIWRIRVGFYSLSTVLQHSAAIVQDIMSSSSLRFCVSNRRENLSEGEKEKLANTKAPFNALLQVFLEDAEEACMNVPNPLQDVNSSLSGLLPAIGQLIMNVLRDTATTDATTNPKFPIEEPLSTAQVPLPSNLPL
eukprot:Gregarina_sp_Poly_1__1617@NODE_140_length_13084_cov_215_910194_g125_i0_p1_GENE_NODE_140_length_13084_cov_215_910194_g125_i0NODE_140_length_13084_cov_215_910194_g125_i0_p1_ORF_typecomplete_len1328_score187_06DUF3712/PF12505_8/0_00037DUF3712/PF12505_8/0_00044ADH_zinc_N_2/PF13602_6/0_29Orf78/PF06024_12/0_36Orf78/PF06024_12/1_8e04_NODE_140_length_13084_cov_215_910194_g125_i0734056